MITNKSFGDLGPTYFICACIEGNGKPTDFFLFCGNNFKFSCKRNPEKVVTAAMSCFVEVSIL